MILTTVEQLPGSDFVAVSIFEPRPGQRHSGAIYRAEDGNFRVVHLAFHFDLRDEMVGAEHTCTRVSLDTTNQAIMAAFLGHLKGREPRIPYGVNSDGTCFDDQGNFLGGPVGHGLTCATFIVAAYTAMRLPMIAEETWPEREDDKTWRDSMVLIMEGLRNEFDIDVAHIEAVRNDPMARRIRPEEVAGAATHSPWPATFPDIETLAAEVLSDLQAAA